MRDLTNNELLIIQLIALALIALNAQRPRLSRWRNNRRIKIRDTYVDLNHTNNEEK